MSDIVIRAEGLGKKYIIGHQSKSGSYVALRDVVAQNLRTFWSKTRDLARGRAVIPGDTQEEIWALKDVDFEIRRGEAVGIIGRNGAGKSTLLKILSRITEPSAGRVTIRGRVASLLEVGTGFHPELTGRENIYLNGAILGMTRAEIRRKFDEIVDFAEVEKFLDTPVKRYSSGMYVRLAFAVAAHLEPEILVVDEVLAVGDAQFQKKCLSKMQEVGRGGRTILFVSHNMSALRQICRRGVCLDHGQVVDVDNIDPVIDVYMAKLFQAYHQQSTIETRLATIHSVRIISQQGAVIKAFDQVEIQVELTTKVTIQDPGLYIGILTTENQRLAGVDFKDFRSVPPLSCGQRVVFTFVIKELPLMPGSYQVEIHLKDMASYTIEQINSPFFFDVVETPIYGGRKLDGWFGCIPLRLESVSLTTSSDLN